MGNAKSGPKTEKGSGAGDPAPAGAAAADPAAADPAAADPAASSKPAAPFPIISTPISKDYSLKTEIGRGFTSKCYMCQDKRTAKFFACKVVDKKKLKMKSGKNPVLLKRLIAEIQILKSVKHPNIVQVDKVYENGNKVYIIMELMRGGELFDHIIDRGCLVETEAISIVRKICSALLYLHEKDIVHRDLKPENILLKKSGDINEIRIIDFGMSKVFEKASPHHSALSKTCSQLGTPGYMAPEIMKSQSYDKAVDMWSLGVVTYVLLCGYMPFDETHGAKTRWAMDFPKAEWSSISDNARNFVECLLTVDPDKRMTAAEATTHKWLSPESDKHVSNKPLASPRRMRGRRRKHFTFDDVPSPDEKSDKS